MEELVIQYLKGDEKAFAMLIQLIQADLFKIAQVKLRNIEDINDAIQETMLLGYKSLKKLEEPKYFKTWIIKILINECNKIYKKNERKRKTFEKLSKNKEGDTYENINELNIEAKLDLEKILEKLNYNEKIAIILFYNCNYSLVEIGKILSISPNTIKSRIMRAKQKIKKSYRGDEKNETIQRK